jgi:hypothetical protein
LQTKGPKSAQATKSAAISPEGSIDVVSKLASVLGTFLNCSFCFDLANSNLRFSIFSQVQSLVQVVSCAFRAPRFPEELFRKLCSPFLSFKYHFALQGIANICYHRDMLPLDDFETVKIQGLESKLLLRCSSSALSEKRPASRALEIYKTAF